MTSAPPPAGPHPPAAHAGAPDHASVRTYVLVAVVLSVVTGLEFAVIYIRALTPILVPLLLVLSAGKFALVALFFMHLRYEPRSLNTIFAGALVIAIGLAIALMTLSGDFLVFRR
jgi:cytochrome c oxidase subunit 4